jgi:RNA polymerase sigma-70 factor (ECF subfamily)
MNYTLVQTKPNHTEDADLVWAAQQGDLEAFNQLVLLYQDRIYSTALRILGDEDSAEDITQNTFLSAYRNLSNFHKGSFLGWLYRIATNACYDELRQRKSHPHQPIELEDDADQEFLPGYDFSYATPTPEKEYERKEFKLVLEKALNRLSADSRAVVVLVDLQDVDYREAAQILGVPLGTMKSRLARARGQLREMFSERVIHPQLLSVAS